MECGYCLIGGIKFVEFVCKNVGLSVGKFCIIPKDQWPAWNIRVKNSPPALEMITILSPREGRHSIVSPVQSLAKTYFSEKPPFAVSPSLFGLQPGEMLMVEVSSSQVQHYYFSFKLISDCLCCNLCCQEIRKMEGLINYL